MKKIPWQTIGIIFGIAIIVLISSLIQKPNNPTNEEIVKCIGENAVLYTQIGCHACKIQENLFGENLKHINIIDCFYEPEKCQDILGTPSWEINGETYLGVQSIEKLKELIGC